LSCSAATLSPPTCSTNSAASFGKSWPRFFEEKNAEIAYLRAIVNGKFARAAQMRLHHAGPEEDKTFVFIARTPRCAVQSHRRHQLRSDRSQP
jgi:hypothetical protein